MENICKDIQIGYTTIKDFNILGITCYSEDSKGLTVKYMDGSSVKYNGSTSAIAVLKIICQTAVENSLLGNSLKRRELVSKIVKDVMSA